MLSVTFHVTEIGGHLNKQTIPLEDHAYSGIWRIFY